jgi:hypothetical protein
MVDLTVNVTVGCAEAFAGGQRSALFRGTIDDAQIWNRALNPAEIAALV